jgi:hypothetical protein
MNGKAKAAVALCKFCSVGLCKEHLMELYRRPVTVPQYTCHHDPAGRPNRPLEIESKPGRHLLSKEFDMESVEVEIVGAHR